MRLAVPLLALAFAASLVRLLIQAGGAGNSAEEASLLFNAASIGLWGTLAIMLLISQAADARAWLFAMTAVAVGSTIIFDTFAAPPVDTVRFHLWIFTACVIYFFNPPIVMHMAGSIPGKNPLLSRYPTFVPAAYIAGALLVVLFTFAYLNEQIGWIPALRIDQERLDSVLRNSVILNYAFAGTIGLTLLGYAGFSDPLDAGRRQAWVVFAGLVPWTLNLIIMISLPGYAASQTGELISELTILLCPLSLFISIARYRLFEVSSALRRALVYGGSFGLVLGAITLGVQAVAELAEQAVGGPLSGWSTILVLLVCGMAAQPLFAAFTQAIEKRLFSERLKLEALRRDLIGLLAREHTVDGMSQRLVQQLSSALNDAHVTLLMLDANGDFYRGRATTLSSVNLPVLPAAWLNTWGAELTHGTGFDRQLSSEMTGLRATLDTAMADSILPVTLDRRPIGLMLVGHSNGWHMEPADRELLNDIMRQASAMLENVRLLDLASNDPLTRLPRRHVAEERIAHELERSARTGAPLCLAMADIDHFKVVNDSYGHAAGDLVLQSVAQTLSQATRRIDLIARWGGEEFLMVFPETDAGGAERHAEALRAAVEGRAVAIGERALNVTISLGVCDISRLDQPTVESAVACVDKALYHAKQSGRNRVATNEVGV